MDLKETIETNFERYAGNVILDRAICDVRDMLKPAARMLTYSQVHITKNTNDKPFVKSARVVGDCLGHYYTHGDASCYGTYMRMAKPFAMRYPLEECQGNSGTIMATGDEASSRYTQLRLSKLGDYLFKDIDKDTIDRWSDNFDETDTYPSVLPSKGFYNIVNGTTGIGVAISSSIPQFNLKEINNSLVNLLWNKDAAINCMPDFATGGILLNAKEVKESLEKGTGAAAALQAVMEYNSKDNCFIVKELPYGVYTNTITDQIQALIEEQPNCGIEGINDGSGKTPDYIIYISKSAAPNKVLELLYKETSLRTFYTINMTVLKDGRTPKVMGLREMLLEHLEHEKVVYRRGFEFDKVKIENRIHILEGLLICLASIDEVVKTIKNSSSTADAATALKTKFLLDDAQAKAVLDMKLSRLAHLEVEKIENEKLNLEKERQKIIEILNSEELLNKEIEKGLKEVALKFGDDRRTKIKDQVVTSNDEKVEIKKVLTVIFIKNNGEIKQLPADEVNTTKKGTKGTLIDKDLKETIVSNNLGSIAICNNDGEIYTLANSIIPNEWTHISNLIECNNIAAAAEFINKENLVIVTKSGIVKKINLKDENFDKAKMWIKIKSDDEIKKIFFGNDNDFIILINSYNKILKFKLEELKAMSRNAQGSTVNKYGIVSIECVSDKDKLFIMNNDGTGKISKVNEIKDSSKASNGVVCCEGASYLKRCGDLFVIDYNGKIIKLVTSDYKSYSYTASGSIFIKL